VTLFNRGRRIPTSSPTSRSCTATATATSTRFAAAAGTPSSTCGFLPRVVRQTVELVDAPYYLYVVDDLRLLATSPSRSTRTRR
jgi:hypothetical protein